MNHRSAYRVRTISRREFLTRSATAAGATMAWPVIVPSAVFGTNAPSNRMTWHPRRAPWKL